MDLRLRLRRAGPGGDPSGTGRRGAAVSLTTPLPVVGQPAHRTGEGRRDGDPDPTKVSVPSTDLGCGSGAVAEKGWDTSILGHARMIVRNKVMPKLCTFQTLGILVKCIA